MNKITKHHILPKSLWGNRHYDNIAKLRETKHRALHTMFHNQAPHEQVLELIDLTWKAINKTFSEAIIETVHWFDIEEMYNEKCVNIDKLIKKLTER